MPLDYSNPLVLNFLTENFVKENEKRITWFTRNKEKIISAATFSENFKDYRVKDIYRAAMELPLPALSCQHIESFVNRRRKVHREAPSLRKSRTMQRPIKTREIPEELLKDIQTDTIMKPIEPEIVKILYEGIPYGGRREYLKIRSRKLPEQKYYLDQTTNHAIGWQLDMGSKINQPLMHGLHCTLMRELINRTGPKPDPHYYQQPLLDHYAKCVT